MTETEIARLLELQKSAYELILWLNERARTKQEILSDANLEKWRFPASCEAWLRDVYGMIPGALRPLEGEIPAFARLFSSFFGTSFKLVENAPTQAYDWSGHATGHVGGGKRRLMPGSPDAPKTRHGKEKVRDTADELRLLALEELALEADLLLERADLQDTALDAALDAELTLWTYVHELNRRAHFASQGAPVRSLWQAMDKREREKISAAKVMRAREKLLAALRAEVKN